MRLFFLGAFFMCACHNGFAQLTAANKWADSVFNTLTNEEKIAQLMVVRTSIRDANGNPVLFNDRLDSLVKIYNIGAVCLFQGTPASILPCSTVCNPRPKPPSWLL